MFALVLSLLAPLALADDAKIYPAPGMCHSSGGTASRSTTGISNTGSATMGLYCGALRDDGGIDGGDTWFVVTDNSSSTGVSCTLREYWYTSTGITSSSRTASTSSGGYSSMPQQLNLGGSVTGDTNGTRIVYCTVPASSSIGTSSLHYFKVDEST